MTKEKVLVVGLGEVGLPLFELLTECERFAVYGIDVDEARMNKIGQKQLPDKVDVIHVCIPCFDKDEFVDTIAGYVDRFSPGLLVINSTVPPGTTVKVHKRCGDCFIVHSPVRGVHQNIEHMKWELKRWIKYIGAVDAESGEAAATHFEKAGFVTRVLMGCVESELAKIFETTYRAWMIACFQEMHRIARSFGGDYSDVVDFLGDTHRVRLDRPVMFPGVIGGHCLIQNVELLLGEYDSEFLRLILASNEKRKEEVKHKSIMREVDDVRKRVEESERN